MCTDHARVCKHNSLMRYALQLLVMAYVEEFLEYENMNMNEKDDTTGTRKKEVIKARLKDLSLKHVQAMYDLLPKEYQDRLVVDKLVREVVMENNANMALQVETLDAWANGQTNLLTGVLVM